MVSPAQGMGPLQPGWAGYRCSMLGSTSPHSANEGGTQAGLALLLQIKRVTWICGLSSLTASFKLLILQQDKQRINNLVEHREPGSSQGKGKPLQHLSPAAGWGFHPPSALRPTNYDPRSELCPPQSAKLSWSLRICPRFSSRNKV